MQQELGIAAQADTWHTVLFFSLFFFPLLSFFHAFFSVPFNVPT